MTIVVTTASARGITVATDRAVSGRGSSGMQLHEAQKGWYSPIANVALAFWGNADLPDSQSLEDWARTFVSHISPTDTVTSVAERLVENLNPELERVADQWSSLRRGIHVSGYESGLPVILHVHTGDPRAFHHALEVHRDYPDIHGGGMSAYRMHLATGGFAQLRNGHHELFGTIAQLAVELQSELSDVLQTPVPAPTLRGQAAFDEALVRFASGLLKSAQLPQVVSDVVNVIAFNQDGQVHL